MSHLRNCRVGNKSSKFKGMKKKLATQRVEDLVLLQQLQKTLSPEISTFIGTFDLKNKQNQLHIKSNLRYFAW